MHVVHLTEGLPAEGFPSSLLCGRVTPDEGDMEYFAEERGVALHHIDGLDRRLRPLPLLRALWGLWRIFRRERPTIVHTHTAMAGAIGRLAAILAGVPVRVHTYHGHVLGGAYFPPLATRVFLGIEQLLARHTQALIVLTPAQREEMARELRIAPSEHFRVIPLGLSLERFRLTPADELQARRAMRGHLGISMETPLVGIVGRLVPVKHHELLLGVMTELPGVHLVVIGGGERDSELQALAEKLGVASRIHWMGWQRELPTLYPGLDLLALTSRDEGTPVAVIEALAAGVPVVATAVGGVPGVLEGGRWGRLVPPEDRAGLLDALREVLADPPSLSHREEGAIRALDRFGDGRLIHDVAELYRELLGLDGGAL